MCFCGKWSGLWFWVALGSDETSWIGIAIVCFLFITVWHDLVGSRGNDDAQNEEFKY